MTMNGCGGIDVVRFVREYNAARWGYLSDPEAGEIAKLERQSASCSWTGVGRNVTLASVLRMIASDRPRARSQALPH